jgi:hypothetical protein
MNTIVQFLLNFIRDLIEELIYRLGYLIAELSDQHDLADRFVTGVKDYGNSPLRAHVLTMQ